MGGTTTEVLLDKAAGGDADVAGHTRQERGTQPLVVEPTLFQQAWRAKWDRVIAHARAVAPQRFTYPGQEVPWVDPVPGPDDVAPYGGPSGMSPRPMLLTVRLMHEEAGREAALQYLEEVEPLVATLRRADWDACLAEERKHLLR